MKLNRKYFVSPQTTVIILFVSIASSNGVFVELLAEYLNNEGNTFTAKNNHIRCICQVLNLCVEGNKYFLFT